MDKVEYLEFVGEDDQDTETARHAAERSERLALLKATGRTLRVMLEARPDEETFYSVLTEEEGGMLLGVFLDYRAVGLDETRAFLNTLQHLAGWIANRQLESLADEE